MRPGADADVLHGSALFLQQGVTRWTDEHGFRRHDVRIGLGWKPHPYLRLDARTGVDEPALATIAKGATSGRATFRLLDNPDLGADRSLSVTVARAA